MASTIHNLREEYYSGKVNLHEFIDQAEILIKKFDPDLDHLELRRRIIDLVGRL